MGFCFFPVVPFSILVARYERQASIGLLRFRIKNHTHLNRHRRSGLYNYRRCGLLVTSLFFGSGDVVRYRTALYGRVETPCHGLPSPVMPYAYQDFLDSRFYPQ